MTDTNTLAPTDAEILALNAGEVHFSESSSKYPAAGFGTQYHAGAPGVLSFARAVLAAKWGTPALASSEPAAVLASGPVGFDHKTAANFLNGKTVTDEEVRQFIAHSRWAHDDRDWLRNTIADLRREIARRDAEIALLKTALLAAEAPQPAAQAQEHHAQRMKALQQGALWDWWRSTNGLEDCVMSEWEDFEKVVRAVESKLGIAYKDEGEQP